MIFPHRCRSIDPVNWICICNCSNLVEIHPVESTDHIRQGGDLKERVVWFYHEMEHSVLQKNVQIIVVL